MKQSSAHSAAKYPDQCRTFGELTWFPQLQSDGRCAFCKQYRNVWKYSDRHYACTACIDSRYFDVLPRVKRREKFEAQLAAIREQPSASEGVER